LFSGTSTTEILLCARSPFSSKRRHSFPYCGDFAYSRDV